jgi:amino-acid N-acetyltransferase
VIQQAPLVCRRGEAAHAPKIHALVSACETDGHLLPRELSEITVHADRFIVALEGRKLVGCAELAPLSRHVAEVRSLSVDGSARGHGIGTMIVEALRQRARREGFETLCAFTHAPGYFIQMGFSIVPHLWVPEKIFTDCAACPRFRRCGQYAMVFPLDSTADLELSDAVSAVCCA